MRPLSLQQQLAEGTTPACGIPASAADGLICSARTPASDKVLSTAELLDAILVQLPYTDLFRCQRVSKQVKACIETSPTVQQAMFLQPRNAIPCKLLANGSDANVEHPGQPLTLLSHYECIGGLVFGGVATDYNTYTPPTLYPNTSCWLFVRQSQCFTDFTRNEGSWRNLLLKNCGGTMDFDTILCPDVWFLDSIKGVFIGGKRAMGELVDAIREDFKVCGFGFPKG